MQKLKLALKTFVKRNKISYFIYLFVRSIWRIPRLFTNHKHYLQIWRDFMGQRDKYCVVCKHKVSKFLPIGGLNEELFVTHHIIGDGAPHDNSLCPYCMSTDRTRWQYYVLKNYSGILDKTCTALHFAAEYSNSELIMENRNCKYITADIDAGRCDITCDMTDLNMFGDNTFDYIIANHVMEHIENENKAISELKRVIKNDGIIILSFPICTDMLTYEDSSITTKEGRLKAFGQEDHVRLYGTDFRERLESYGLNVKIYSPENELTPEEITKYGFLKDDVSIFCTLKQ